MAAKTRGIAEKTLRRAAIKVPVKKRRCNVGAGGNGFWE